MTEHISFNIINKQDFELCLFIEPFGIAFDILVNQSYFLSFKSTKKHDIGNDISIIYKDKQVEVSIEGGWINFELFQDGILLIQLET